MSFKHNDVISNGWDPEGHAAHQPQQEGGGDDSALPTGLQLPREREDENLSPHLVPFIYSSSLEQWSNVRTMSSCWRDTFRCVCVCVCVLSPQNVWKLLADWTKCNNVAWRAKDPAESFRTSLNPTPPPPPADFSVKKKIPSVQT